MHGIGEFFLLCAALAPFPAATAAALTRWSRLVIIACVTAAIFVLATAITYQAGRGAIVVGLFAAGIAVVPITAGTFLGVLFRRK